MAIERAARRRRHRPRGRCARSMSRQLLLHPGVGAFGGRVLHARGRSPPRPPGRCSQPPRLAGGIRSGPVGSGFHFRRRRPSVHGHRRRAPGIFRRNPARRSPRHWIPLQQEPSSRRIARSAAIGRRMAAGDRPRAARASTARDGPRLTGVLRQWMRNESGYPSNWMAEVVRMLPQQVINVVPAGAGVAVMKEEYGRSLQILMAVCGWCCSSRAPTSRICCWPGRWRRAAKPRCAWRWGPRGGRS